VPARRKANSGRPPREMTVPQAAERLGVEPRILRRHLRGIGQGVGQGGRYTIPSKALQLLRKKLA
jgi:hypothetical protein